MKILVTGGAGFIGSHLAERLVGDGHDVVIIDNESTGRRAHVPSRARYIKGDVARLDDLDSAFDSRPDAVCHIAGQVSLIRSFSNPVADLRTNVEGTVNVLQLCVKYRVPRLLYASSMTLYGGTTRLPTPETEPCVPVSYYGITKYAAERYAQATAERIDLGSDFHVTCFRMYNVYGPRQALDNPYQGVLGIFLGNMLRNEPITIFGDGEQTRDFVFIDDVVNAWVAALDSRASLGATLNLGSGQGLTINNLADHVLGAFGCTRSTATVLYEPARPGEQRHAMADVSRAYEVLGWRPSTGFAAGLAETTKWARTALL